MDWKAENVKSRYIDDLTNEECYKIAWLAMGQPDELIITDIKRLSLLMKTTDIDKILPEHRVGYIGSYNPMVITCPFCQTILNNSDCIGYGTDMQGNIVEVSECPECFEITHHHFFGWSYYEMFKIQKELNKKKEFKIGDIVSVKTDKITKCEITTHEEVEDWEEVHYEIYEYIQSVPTIVGKVISNPIPMQRIDDDNKLIDDFFCHVEFEYNNYTFSLIYFLHEMIHEK